MKKVLITGTFDRLHPGHISFLNQAKQLGDYLTVIIARDKTVRMIKGKLPNNNEVKRAKAIKKTKIANRVILGKVNDKYSIIEQEKPNIIALGYDQKAFTQNLINELDKRNVKSKIIRLKSYQPHKFKSSLIKKG